MGGKKKKGLSNKLAKMSEDERAKYLQHRADIEEEARRKKEQLINIYLKNKIKKEEAFARLNLAKINQHWHQILRKSKCTEMKNNIKEIRESTQRLLQVKNTTIEMLLEELDHAEFQYSFNFQSHINSVDQLLHCHKSYIQQLSDEYNKERCLVLENAEIERENVLRNIENETKYFKILNFAQEAKAQDNFLQIKEDFANKTKEDKILWILKLESIRKSCQNNSSELWKAMTTILQNYIRHTDIQRAHYTQLVCLDKRSVAEITQNDVTLKQAEERISFLNKESERKQVQYDRNVTSLKKQRTELQKQLQKRRKSLQRLIKNDETKLLRLTNVSNDTMEYLATTSTKGRELLELSSICRKYQTAEEKALMSDSYGNAAASKYDIEEFQWLGHLDRVWELYNRAAIDCNAVRGEKKRLLKEKQQLIVSLRNVLEVNR